MKDETGNILIADAGGTGTHWCLIDKRGAVAGEHKGPAINPAVMTREDISAAIMSAAYLFPDAQEVHFYGAGCIGEAAQTICDLLLADVSRCEVKVNSDILAAARSLFGEESGIVCIMGTGSNSCLYERGELKYNVPPLGYILGDEGSGAAIGKRFLKKYMRGGFDEDICRQLAQEADLTPDTIYKCVYRTPGANKYLASMTRLLKRHIEYPEISEVVEAEFNTFFSNIVSAYEGAQKLPIGFVGSVAYHFSSILRRVAETHRFRISKILQTPMPGLIEYHACKV